MYSIDELQEVYDIGGNPITEVYDIGGNLLKSYNVGIIYDAVHSSRNIYSGGYIEIQPDSWDGSLPAYDSTSETWGFPMSLSKESNMSIKEELFSGNGYGVSFIRMPMGFAYRGYRNIDETTGLAKNIGERFEGQNASLRAWFENIANEGGGLSVEYWCPAPYWVTGGAYYNADVNNELCAGGNYEQSVSLASIRESDTEQYNAQIDAYTDAIVDDLEYLHQNVCPVRMYTLGAEPSGSGKLLYGHCYWNTNVYNDVFEVLHPKVMASEILSTWSGKPNKVLMHLAASDLGFSIASTMISNHSDWIWGYSSDLIRNLNGETGDYGADYLKSDAWNNIRKLHWKNVFTCEYEYFTDARGNDYRCSNNIVRMILELALGKAKVIMPIIHICKPTGQTSTQTNTKGYCLYAVDMESGNYTTNTWAYNSWKMFNDNLPIGAELVTGGDGGLNKAGYAHFEYEGKTYLFLGNFSDVAQNISVGFSKALSLNGKLYNMTNLGTETESVSGSSITFTIPAYSGLVYASI